MLSLESLADLLQAHRPDFDTKVRGFSLGRRKFEFNSQPTVMGVVNLSPDSWYRESVCLNTESAIRRARVLHQQGADIIDLGAESSLAHAARADAQTQSAKLLPIVRELARAGILVSLETYDAAVARAALEAGANILNHTGSAGTDQIYRMAADHEAAVIICYVHGSNVREVQDFDLSADPIELLREYFTRQIEIATKAGLERFILDPGLGFYYRNLQDSVVRIRHQMKVFLNTFRLRALGFPICHALPHAFECFGEEVRSAEPFFAVLAALGKTDVFRTHEVAKIRAVLDTLSLY